MQAGRTKEHESFADKISLLSIQLRRFSAPQFESMNDFRPEKLADEY